MVNSFRNDDSDRKNSLRSKKRNGSSVASKKRKDTNKENKTRNTRNDSYAGTLQFMGFTVVCVAFFVLAACLAFSGYKYFTTSTLFNVNQIRITGLVHLTEKEVLETAGLKKGVNSFAFNVSVIEKNLRTNPWIKGLSIKRKLPDTFEIRILERQPVFWIREKGKLYYADDLGDKIAPVRAGNFMSLPLLEVKTEFDHLKHIGGEILSEIQSIKGLEKKLGQVSKISVTDEDGIVLHFADERMVITLKTDNYRTGLEQLKSVLFDLAKKNELNTTVEIWITNSVAWTVRNDTTPIPNKITSIPDRTDPLRNGTSPPPRKKNLRR